MTFTRVPFKIKPLRPAVRPECEPDPNNRASGTVKPPLPRESNRSWDSQRSRGKHGFLGIQQVTLRSPHDASRQF
eukprot:5653419-Pyramimonas_sp.AAC.1